MFDPILPSSLLEVASESTFSYGDRLHNNSSLRVGTIIEIIPPDSDDSINKISNEYSVMTIQSSNGNPNSVIYKGIMAIDSFGGIADYFEVQRRAPKDSKKVSRSGSLKNQVGSIVLLLFLDSSSEKGIIIGALQHPDRKTKLSKDVFAAGALNGVEWVINTDGSFSLVFKGQTNADGTPVDEKIGGSSITIGKDGTISLKDNNKESLIIDQNNKIVSVNAEKDINFNADNNINISAKASGNITIKDLMLKASGAANIESTGEMSVKSSGNLGVKSSSMKLESDSTINIKGTDITLDAQSINIGVGGSPAVTLQTKFIGLGNMGIPVISIACGPFSSSVKIGN